MKPKLTIPQCQEILRRAQSDQGAKIFGEIAESISELLGERDAEHESGERWEEDATALLEALDENVTPETCDNATGVALEKIKALKHIAFAFAKHGDCQCNREIFQENLCPYCIAVAVTKDLKPEHEKSCYAMDDYFRPEVARPESESTTR